MPDFGYWMNAFRKNGLKTGVSMVKGKVDHHQQVRRTQEREKIVMQREQEWKQFCKAGPHIDYKLEGGNTMYLYMDSKICEYIYCRDFEHEEQTFLQSFLKHGDIFVDIGANVGLFTLIAATSVGTSGRVHAFEPVGKTFHRLQENVMRNNLSNVEPHNLALSNVAGAFDMTISLDGFDGWNSLAHPTMGEQLATETVTTETWDEFACTHDLVGKVALMKIDVEGWEVHVLQGAKRTLSRPDAPVLMVEFADTTSQAAGSTSRELYQALEDLGYKMYIFDMKRKTFVFDPLRDAYPYDNIFAIKDIEAASARFSGVAS